VCVCVGVCGCVVCVSVTEDNRRFSVGSRVSITYTGFRYLKSLRGCTVFSLFEALEPLRSLIMTS
jgi:hypothetical protein